MVNPNPIFLQNIFTFKNLPVQQKQRKWTDCCCTLFTALFALILFILSFVMFTQYNYYQLNFPADDQGLTCYNQLHDYPFMYFLNPLNVQSGRFCLKQCPKAGDTISCNKNINDKANCKAIVSSYDTQPEVNKIGAFCSPIDLALRKKMFSTSQLGNKISLTHGYDMIRFGLLCGFLVGLIYLAFVGCLNDFITFGVYIMAAVILVVSSLYVLFKPVNLFKNQVLLVFLVLIMVLFAVGYIVYFNCNKKQLDLASIFMKHSNLFLKQRFTVYLYIPLFLLFTVGFLVLIVWQYIAFGTANYPYFEKQAIYYHSNHCIFLQILNVVQLVWGLQFLRDAFNFVVSGNAVQWYFRSITDSHHCFKPFTRLITKHWGSVAGGSFLNAYFKVFGVFGDFFKCDPNSGYDGCENNYEKFCCCNGLFELMRTDAYSYINLTGIPYCNAVRQCQALCRYSNLVNGTQSCLKTYRNAAHIFVIGLGLFLCYVIFDAQTQNYGSFDNFWIIICAIFVVYSMTTYFIDIHHNGGEAIFVCYLTQQNCEGEDLISVCGGDLRRDIFNFRAEYL